MLNGCGSGDNRVLEEVSKRFIRSNPSANVSIQNRDGAVSVYGSNNNEMRVRCVKKAYSHERLNQIAMDVSTKPGAVSVTTKFPPNQTGRFRIGQARSITPLSSLQLPEFPRLT